MILIFRRLVCWTCILFIVSNFVFIEAADGNQFSSATLSFAIPKSRSPRSIRGKPGRPGPRGPPGDKGEKGEHGRPGMPGFPGPRGPEGIQGPPGDRGDRGETGELGEVGPIGLPGKKLACENYASGLACLDGPNGKQGVKGAQGAKGNDGLKGVVGTPGLRGIKGNKGKRGAPGLPGLPGTVAGPDCTARYTNWVRMNDFVDGKQGMMCGDMEFLWNVIAETENSKLRLRFHCCQFLQLGFGIL